jgi:hypothetical protein
MATAKDPPPIIYKTVALQCLAVLLGIVWWRAANSLRRGGASLEYWPLAGFLAVILICIAAYRAFRARRSQGDRRLAAMIGGVGFYAGFVLLIDPFLWIEDRAEHALLAGVLIPPLLAIKPLVRSGSWLAVWGIVLFSTAGVACLLYNGTVRRSGVGFSGFWLS